MVIYCAFCYAVSDIVATLFGTYEVGYVFIDEFYGEIEVVI